MSEPKETVLVISDTQYPFAHKDHLDFLDCVKRRYRPTRVVHIGDEIDCHALSEYDHDPDGDSAGVEYQKAMKEMAKLYALFPKAQACYSNHTARPFRRAYKFGLPSVYLKTYSEFMQAPAGWEWGNKFAIDDVLYEHGEGCSGKLAHLKAAEDNMQSTVMGHLHTNFGVEYSANPKYLIFGMAVGCLIDDKAYAFAYGRANKKKSILGCGIVDKGIPTVVPMLLERGGKWRGRL